MIVDYKRYWLATLASVPVSALAGLLLPTGFIPLWFAVFAWALWETNYFGAWREQPDETSADNIDQELADLLKDK